MTQEKFFQIHSATACKSKWNWSTIWLQLGETASCHRVDRELIPKENFASFHNLPNKIKDRTLMLEGQWPGRGCEYCKNIEDSGGFSDRLYHRTIPGNIPDELLKDTTAVEVTPKIVEVYLNNTCNFGCVYCVANLSSKIDAEVKKFGEFKHNSISITSSQCDNQTQSLYFTLFVDWLKDNITNIERLNVLGGEPFYQKDFEELLNVIDSYGHRNLVLNVVSNIHVPRFKEKIDKIKQLIRNKKIKKFALTVSIDGWGKEQEYQRYGLDWKTFQENFEYVVSEKWIEIVCNLTITSLTFKTIPNLLKYLYEIRKQRYLMINFAEVTFAPYLHPMIFGSGFWQQDIESILDTMSTENENDKNLKKYMEGICNHIDTSPKNQSLIADLKVFLNEIDRRRNLDWRKTFPYLDVKL